MQNVPEQRAKKNSCGLRGIKQKETNVWREATKSVLFNKRHQNDQNQGGNDWQGV